MMRRAGIISGLGLAAQVLSAAYAYACGVPPTPEYVPDNGTASQEATRGLANPKDTSKDIPKVETTGTVKMEPGEQGRCPGDSGYYLRANVDVSDKTIGKNFRGHVIVVTDPQKFAANKDSSAPMIYLTKGDDTDFILGANELVLGTMISTSAKDQMESSGYFVVTNLPKPEPTPYFSRGLSPN